MSGGTRAGLAAYMRTLEVLYRRAGRFESAVQAQQCADAVSGSGSLPIPSCSWFQRGIERSPHVFVLDGMLGIELVNGMVHYLTEDAALDLWGRLTAYLRINGATLRSVARSIDEQRITVDYDDAHQSPKEPPCEKS